MQGGNESKKCDLLEHYIVRSPYALRAETATTLGCIGHGCSSVQVRTNLACVVVSTLLTSYCIHSTARPSYVIFTALSASYGSLLMHTSLGFRMHALKVISSSTVLQSSSDIVRERRLAGWRLVVSHTPSASCPCLSPLFTATSSLWVYTPN